MSAPSLSNVFSDVYITGNCTVKGTISSLAGSITSQWTTSGSIIYYTSGNVGIGTNNPSGSGTPGSLLHVYDATSASPTVHVDSSGGTGQARLHLRAGAGATNRASRIDFFNNVTSSTVPQWTIISGYDQNGTNDMRYVNYAGAITMAWAQNGNIGIGTTNPGSLLTVSGGVGIGSGYNAFTAPTGGLIVQGNVGIGTSNPGLNALQVTGNVVTSGFTSNATNTVFNFDTLTVPFVNATQVGIGVTIPQSPLHVNAIVGGNGLTIGPDTPYVTSGSMFGLAIINSTLTSGQSSVIQIGRAGTDTMFISHNYTGASASSYLAFAGYGYSTQGSLCIRNDGKVGIGTSNPQGTFNVLSGNAGFPDSSGSGSSNVAARIQSGSICLDFGSIGGTNPFWIQNHLNTAWNTTYPILLNPNGGNVGIGTTSPRCTLDVVGSGTTAGIFANRFYLATPGDNTDSSGALNDGGPWYGLGYSVDTGLTSYVQLASFYGLALKVGSGNIVMYGGNVGIGTTSPGYALDIGNFGSSTYTLRLAAASTASGTMGTSIRMMEANDTYGFSFQNLSGSRFGIFRHSASSAGSEIISIMRDNPFVGIGTTNPLDKLDIRGGSISLGEYFTSTGSRYVGFGYNDGSSYRCIAGMEIENTTLGGNYSQKLHFRTHAYGVSEGRRMTISEGGNVGIGTTNPGPMLDIWATGTTFQNSGSLRFYRSDAATSWKFSGPDTGNTLYLQNAAGTGVYITNGATSWTGTSDSRLKNIIAPISNALSKVDLLNPVMYSWKNDETNEPHPGLIAQDVLEVQPEVVSTDKDGMYGVRYTELVPLAFAAIKEISAENTALKQLLETAAARLESMEQRLAALEGTIGSRVGA